MLVEWLQKNGEKTDAFGKIMAISHLEIQPRTIQRQVLFNRKYMDEPMVTSEVIPSSPRSNVYDKQAPLNVKMRKRTKTATIACCWSKWHRRKMFVQVFFRRATTAISVVHWHRISLWASSKDNEGDDTVLECWLQAQLLHSTMGPLPTS